LQARGIGFCGFNKTAESLLTPKNLHENYDRLSFPIQGNHGKNKYIGKQCIHIITRKSKYYEGSQKKSVTDFGDFQIEYLGESEAICETALVRESGPSGDCLIKETEGLNRSNDCWITLHFFSWHHENWENMFKAVAARVNQGHIGRIVWWRKKTDGRRALDCAHLPVLQRGIQLPFVQRF
jgi:hypothetical protein